MKRVLQTMGLICGFLLYPGAVVACDDNLAQLVEGLRKDYREMGSSTLSVNNGSIVIETPRIGKIVAAGPKALRLLIREMERRNVSLDTFARCYSACDLILRKAGLKSGVRWHGGLIRIKGQGRRGCAELRIVGTSRIDGFSKSFRRAQVDEIVRRAKEVKIHLRIRQRGVCITDIWPRESRGGR